MKTYLNQFPNDVSLEFKKERTAYLTSQWLSAKVIREVLETYLSTELHKLIELDEQLHNKNANPDISHWANIGERKRVRDLKNKLFGKTDIGDE